MITKFSKANVNYTILLLPLWWVAEQEREERGIAEARVRVNVVENAANIKIS